MVKKNKKKINKRIPESKDELPKKSIREKETHQLIWFFIIVVLVFASVLIPYFHIQKSKTFSYAGVTWTTENYKQFDVYHSEFSALNGENYTYNVFLRNDPRKNNVSAEGTFREFKVGGYVSISPEVDSCRGGVARIMLDLGSFLKFGVGVKKVQAATPNFEVHNQTGKIYATCNTQGRTIIMIEKGNSSVEQSKTNPFCYKIKVENCNDIAPVEKFMTKVIGTVRGQD